VFVAGPRRSRTGRCRSGCATARSGAPGPSRGDRLALQRVNQVRAEAVVLQQLYQPPPPERGLKRHRGARWQPPDHAQDRLRPIGHVAVGQYLPALIDHRHLRALAVHVDSGVNRHSRASFPSSRTPGASGYRAEQGRVPERASRHPMPPAMCRVRRRAETGQDHLVGHWCDRSSMVASPADARW
jgi:hypothetical protein